MSDKFMLKAVLSANADGMLKTLKSVNLATKNTRKYLLDVAKSAGNLAEQVGMPLGLIGGALSAFSIAGVQQAVAGFAELGDQVVKSAQRLGIGTAEYQRLEYVAGQSGVSVDGLASSMGRLNKGIAMAAAGKNKDLASLFARAGISMRDASGKLRSSADMLPEIADLFARNGNAAVQARMGNAIFGKSWQELAPLLQGGGKGIEELEKRYKKLGLVISHDALKAGEEFGDQMADMQRVVKSYGYNIAAKLLPAFGPLIEKTIQWAVQNRNLITTNVSAFITDMATSLKKVDWSGAINGVKDFFSGCKDLIEQIGGAKNALLALVFVMNIQTITAIGGLIGALGKLGWSFIGLAAKAYIASNASLLSLLRIGAVALFVAGPMGVLGAAFAWLGGAAAGAGGLISGAMGVASMAVRGLGAALMANPLGVIIGIATAAYLIYKNWGTLKGWFAGFFDWVGEKFALFLGWAKDLAGMVGGIFELGGSGAVPGINDHSSQPSLVGNQQAKVGGEITVKFDNAPAGMRIEQSGGQGPVALNTDVGYRSFATGMTY